MHRLSGAPGTTQNGACKRPRGQADYDNVADFCPIGHESPWMALSLCHALAAADVYLYITAQLRTCGETHEMSAQPNTNAAAGGAIGPIAIIGALFFIMGWFTWINGPLITFVQLAFDLNVVNAFLVTFVFYLSYFVWALPASVILDRTGMKRGMALALWVMALGAIAFGEFCTRRWYPGALGGLFVI